MVGSDKTLSSWREVGHEMEKVFESTFFEIPLSISMHPIGVHFILVFKEFVKFCFYEHSELKFYFTLNIRNVSEARYI